MLHFHKILMVYFCIYKYKYIQIYKVYKNIQRKVLKQQIRMVCSQRVQVEHVKFAGILHLNF